MSTTGQRSSPLRPWRKQVPINTPPQASPRQRHRPSCKRPAMDSTDPPPASPSSPGPPGGQPSPPKRPAGRTKFQETRHPVFRGVRRRGRAGRWVCEVRVPGSRGDRLWVGTFDTAEAAARAHDAAMLALCGAAASLNFADSAWLLHVPRAPAGLPGVQRAATDAVAAFLRTQQPRGGGDAPAAASQGQRANAATETELDHAGASAAAVDGGGGSVVEVDVFGGMDDAGSYYASLAQGLLIDPPPPAVECPEEEDDDCGGAGEMELWD
uniref:AP2/ERF domain-containing protein n=2 Tax=Zea mays TaxID=4577 RepID=A0A804LUJ1_MAIZE